MRQYTSLMKIKFDAIDDCSAFILFKTPVGPVVVAELVARLLRQRGDSYNETIGKIPLKVRTSQAQPNLHLHIEIKKMNVGKYDYSLCS